MIVFTDKVEFLHILHEARPKDKLIIANFTSAYSGYEDCTVLATRINKISRPEGMRMIDFMQDPSFDAAYAKMVLTDVKMFEALMRIILNDFENSTIGLLVIRDDYRDALMDSLSNFIQSRYGRRSWLLEDIDDLQVIDEAEYWESSGYDSDGLLRLDEDRKRYLELSNSGQCSVVLDPVNLEVHGLTEEE